MEPEIAEQCGFDEYLRLERRAAKMPASVAVIAPGRTPLSYADLYQHIRTVRSALSSAGVRPNDVTALVSPNGPEFITAFLAISGMGACAPLDPNLTESEYAFYLGRLAARTLVHQDGRNLPAVAAARALGMQVVGIRSDPAEPAGIFTVAAPVGQPAESSGRKTEAALLLFTSATTGVPKLVPHTWANLRVMAQHETNALQLCAEDRFLSLMPLFHLHGLAAVLAQLFHGGTVIGTPGFEPDRFVAWLDELRPTWFTSSPPMNRVILALAREHPEIFRRSPLRLIRSTGAVPEPELLTLLEEAVGAPVLDGYGLTETGGVTRNKADFRKPRSAGRSSGLDVAIMDPSGIRVAAGLEGEIVVRGASVTSGYLDNEEANRATFRDGWFHTGDLGRVDDDGFLFITGRLKEMINRGGEKILPQEVDEVLRSHPALLEAAVFAVEHPTLGEDLGAAVVLRHSSVATESEIRRFTATLLAPFKIPRRVFFVEEIPRTATGKPRRGILAEQFRDRMTSHGEAASRPLDGVEEKLIEIWRRILRIERIDIEDDFFSLGGDSLAAAVMLSDVQKSLQVHPRMLERLDFFDHPTIVSLARIIADSGEAPEVAEIQPEPSRILELQSKGSRIPLFCLPASYPDPYYFRHLSKLLGAEQPFFVVRSAQPIVDDRLLSVNELARLSVEAIRCVRPHGPYVIGGHCYGGVVAFETALQLAAEGEHIACLVLFDVKTPGYPKLHKQWKRYLNQARNLLLAPLRGRRLITRGAMAEHVRTLRRLVTRRFAGRASRALAAVGSDALVTGRDDRALRGMAMWEYVPRDFPAPIIHFIAADEPVSTELLSDPRLGWRDFAPAGLHEQIVRGDHNSMFTPANAEDIAERLTAALRTAGFVTPPATSDYPQALAAKK